MNSSSTPTFRQRIKKTLEGSSGAIFEKVSEKEVLEHLGRMQKQGNLPITPNEKSLIKGLAG